MVAQDPGSLEEMVNFLLDEGRGKDQSKPGYGDGAREVAEGFLGFS